MTDAASTAVEPVARPAMPAARPAESAGIAARVAHQWGGSPEPRRTPWFGCGGLRSPPRVGSRWRRLSLFTGLLLLLAVRADAQGLRVEPRLYIPPVNQTLDAAGKVSPPGAEALLAPQSIALPELNAGPMKTPNASGLVPVGVTRSILVEQFQRGQWQSLPGGGSVWRLSIHSAGAVSLRIHFTEFDVGAGRVWVYPADTRSGDVAGPYAGRGIHGDGEFWSAAVLGDTVTLEYEPAGGTSSLLPPFRALEISHIWEDEAVAGAAVALEAAPKAAAACELDYKCYQEWTDPGRSVAHIRFVEMPFVYTCTGSLLATRNGSQRPLLLTAAHCLRTEAVARTLEARFFYETASCNGPDPGLSSASVVNGSHLLVTRPAAEGDFSLLELSGLPAQPVWFAGWDATELSPSQNAATIHHPMGSYKRISFGNRVADEPGPGIRPADFYYQIRYTEGRTEAGSSGAPLFRTDGSAFYVVGTLSYGTAAPPGGTVCDVSIFQDGFGRFSVMYPVLAPYLEEQAAVYSLSATPLALEYELRGALLIPNRRSIQLSTNSPLSVPFTARADPSWVVLSSTSGTISAAAPGTLEIAVNPLLFPAAGDYTAHVEVTAPGLTPPVISVEVKLRVVGPRVTAVSFRNAASWEAGAVAGSLATITGSGLATGLRGCVSSSSTVAPLPTKLDGVEVRFGDYAAPLLAVCNIDGLEFVNVQVPFEMAPGTAWVRVQAFGEWALLNDAPILPVQPGVFEAVLGGGLRSIVVKPDGSLATPASGARLGQRVVAYATGLGPVLPLAQTNRPGVPGQRVYYPVAVRINDIDVWPAAVEYSPGLLGVYQITFDIPANAPTGPAIPFRIAAQPGDGQFWVFGKASSISISP